MMKFDLSSDVDPEHQCDVLLLGRPSESGTRVHWWVAVFDEVDRELLLDHPAAVRGRVFDLALRMLERARRDRDLSAVDGVVVLVGLAKRVGEGEAVPVDLTADGIAIRALKAIPVSAEEIPDLVARERKFLMEDERAWHPSSFDQSAVYPEFEKIEDLRRLLYCLEGLGSGIKDELSRARVSGWSAIGKQLEHGPEVAAMGRELVARKVRLSSD